MKLYDKNKKLTDSYIFKWLCLYWEGVKENTLLCKIIVTILAIASSVAAIIPFINEIDVSEIIKGAVFLTFCNIVLFLPFRSPIRSFHWDYRILFILAYGYRMYSVLKSLIYMISGDYAEFKDCWWIAWFINLLIFAGVLQINLLIHKLYEKKIR